MNTLSNPVMPADDINAAVRLHDEGMAAPAEGDYARALRLGLEAFGMLERLEGAAPPDVANVLNHIGGAHVDCGDYAGLPSVSVPTK